MPYEAIVALISAVIASLADRLLRKLAEQKRSRLVADVAQRELDSLHPDTTNDPGEAIDKAYLAHNRTRIRSESIKFLRPRPGSHSERNGDAHKGDSE